MTTKKEENFLRTVYLNYRVATRALRRYFDTKHPNLASDLSFNYNTLHSLYKRGILYQCQWDILYPPSGSNTVSSADFDVTLMMFLLRNLPPTVSEPLTGFNALPMSSDNSDGAHIVRIKYYKNNLVSHSKDGILTDTDYKTIWSDLEKAIRGLGNHQDVQDAADAKSIVLDHESVKKLINQHDFFYQTLEDHDTKITKLDTDHIQQNRKRSNDHVKHEYKLDVHSTKRAKLDSAVENMETDIQSVKKSIAVESGKDWMIKTLQKWEKNEEYFVNTTATDHVMNCIREKKCVSVVGPFGVGKTFLVQHVALEMQKNGYSIISVIDPNQIKEKYQRNKKTLFIIDDMCAKYTATTGRLDVWKNAMTDITCILEDHCCKLILTCRLQVFQDEGFKFSSLQLFKTCVCNLVDKKLALTSSEKDKFATKYFKNINKNRLDCLYKYDVFPLFCKLYDITKNEPNFCLKTFLTGPFDFYRKELDDLFVDCIDGKYKFGALLVLVVCNNWLRITALSGKDDKFTKILHDTAEACGIKLTCKSLQLELNTLTGTFVSNKRGSYCTIHDKLFDFLVYYFGTKNEITQTDFIELLIQHTDVYFIDQRFVIEEGGHFDDNRQQEYVINIPQNKLQLYIERIFDIMTTSFSYDLKRNRNRNNKTFQTKLQTFMNELDKVKISALIENANYEFVRKMFVMNVKDIKSIVNEEYERYGIILEHENKQKYVEWMFNHLAKGFDVEETMFLIRSCRSEAFNFAVVTYIKQLCPDRIGKLIRMAGTSFVQSMFVISKEDIKPSSRHIYKRYGIEIPNDIIQVYIERVFNDITKSKDVNKEFNCNRNRRNATFHQQLLGYMKQLDTLKIEHVVKTASYDFLDRLCVLSNEDIKMTSDIEYERYGVLIPEDCRQIYFARWIEKMTESDVIENYFEHNRNSQSVIFRKSLQTYLTHLQDEEIGKLIQRPSDDFSHKLFVTTLEDIKHDSQYEYEHYGILLQGTNFQTYIENIWYDSMECPENFIEALKSNRTARSVVKYVRQKYMSSSITQLIDTASKEVFHEMLSVDIKNESRSAEKYTDLQYEHVLANILQMKEGLITCPLDHIDKYMEKMILDWKQGKLGCVLCNINMENQSFVQRFLEYLNRLDLSNVLELVDTDDQRYPDLYFDSQDSGCVSLTMSCYFGNVNLAKWCLEKYLLHVSPNTEHHCTLCALFMLVLYNNHLEKRVLNGDVTKVNDAIQMFRRELGICKQISLERIKEELSTSLTNFISVRNGVYSITDTHIFKFLVFYFASDRHLSNILIEHAEEAILYERFFLKQTNGEPFVIVNLPDKELQRWSEKIFRLMTQCEKTLRIILRYIIIFHYINVKPISAYIGKINKEEIKKIIEQSCFGFINKMCVMACKERIGNKDLEIEPYISIPDEYIALYLEKHFDQLASSDCVEACLKGNRNINNIKFHNSLLSYMRGMKRDFIEQLINKASSDFISRMFVISEVDIKDESFWEYERYGIVVPGELLPQYVQRVFSDMKKAVFVSVNRNIDNKTFRDALYSYTCSLSTDTLTSLIETATCKCVSRIILTTDVNVTEIFARRTEYYLWLLPQKNFKLFRQQLPEEDTFLRSSYATISDDYCSCKMISDEKKECAFVIANVKRNSESITDNHFHQQLIHYIDPMFTSKTIKCCVKSLIGVVVIYIKRMLADWMEGNVHDVLGNDNLRNTSFLKEFLNYLRLIDTSTQTKLVNTKDNKFGDSPLAVSCYIGIKELVNWCLDNNAAINTKNRFNDDPLSIAFEQNHLVIVNRLLNYLNTDDVNECTNALCHACKGGHIEIVLLLLKKNINVNLCPSSFGETPLFVACKYGHHDVVDVLLKQQADDIDINKSKESDRASPLYISCKKGYGHIVSLLLDHEADELDVNQHTMLWETPLYAACEGGHKEIVSSILASEPKGINKSRLDGATSLFVACSRGHTEVVYILLNQNGINIDKCMMTGESPLFIASLLGHAKIVEMLLSRNADDSICVKKKEIVEILFKKFEKNKTMSYRRLELSEITNFKKYIKYIRKLVIDNASEHVKSYIYGMNDEILSNLFFGSSPLHIGSVMGNVETIKILVNMRISNINFLNANGSTPLSLACELGHETIVRVLLANGANQTLKRKDGRSPLCIAEENGNMKIVNMIKEQTLK